MLALVLDSATPAVTTALGRVTPTGTTIVAEQVTVDPRAHGERLAPQIEIVLERAGATIGDLDAVVAGVGPGPFTGLRVGLVTAAALADALGIPAYGVCTLDAFAVGRAGRVLVATDARRKEIYWGCYADGVRLAGPEVSKPAEVAGRAAGMGAQLAVGDGALRYSADLGLAVEDEPRFPPPGALLWLARARILAGASSEILTPLYLRRPDIAAPGGRKRVLS